MHEVTDWEASRSGAGITVAITNGSGARRKLYVKKIVSKNGTVAAHGGDGSRFTLQSGRETSPELAAIAGDLLNLTVTEIGLCEGDELEMLVAKVRQLAASALGQHQ